MFWTFGTEQSDHCGHWNLGHSDGFVASGQYVGTSLGSLTTLSRVFFLRHIGSDSYFKQRFSMAGVGPSMAGVRALQTLRVANRARTSATLVVTGASLLVTGALLVVTMFAIRIK